jgi:site-specific recombinase XerC
MTCITSEAGNRYTAHHHQRETSALESARQNRHTDPLHTASAERRHAAAYRMAEDPALPLTDVQLVLGHALLTTTQLYLTPRKEDVIRRILAHHAEQVRQARQRVRPAPAPGYRPESLDVLFGHGTW